MKLLEKQSRCCSWERSLVSQWSKILCLNNGTLLPSRQEAIELCVGCAKTGGPVCLFLEEGKGLKKNKARENKKNLTAFASMSCPIGRDHPCMEQAGGLGVYCQANSSMNLNSAEHSASLSMIA